MSDFRPRFMPGQPDDPDHPGETPEAYLERVGPFLRVLTLVCEAVPETEEPPLVWDAALGRHRYARSADDRGDPDPEKGDFP